MGSTDIAVPTRIATAIENISNDPSTKDGIQAMLTRQSEFSSLLTAQLSGIAAFPKSREYFDMELDAMWARESERPADDVPEVVIGAGLHAAIYCAVRARMGHPKPLVFEARDTVGGQFAVSREPSFYLNSRNRPGTIGLPGSMQALNALPGGVIQPSDLSGDEYQRNSDLAFAIRATLATFARVRIGRKVTSIIPASSYNPFISEPDSLSLSRRRYVVGLSDGTATYTDRIIIATGLGTPKRIGRIGRRVMNYNEFMSSLDKPFPFQGLQRVAVIGQGDSGKTVVEALAGQGPRTSMSVASLDWVKKIDWYGLNQFYSCQSWEQSNRSRYRGIGRLFARSTDEDGDPVPTDEAARIVCRVEQASNVGEGFDQAFVNERVYDAVICANGFERRTVDEPRTEFAGTKTPMLMGGRVVASRLDQEDVFFVGPCAEIGVSSMENVAAQGIATIPENSAALFRYAGRTAALAAQLPRQRGR